MLDESFRTNLAKGNKVTASSTRRGGKLFQAQNLADGNDQTFWCTEEGVTKASFTVDLGENKIVNRVLLQEYIPLGQRVQSFSVEYWDGEAFHLLDRQTTIGYKRILQFPEVETSKIRVTILEAKASPVMAEIQLYHAPDIR